MRIIENFKSYSVNEIVPVFPDKNTISPVLNILVAPLAPTRHGSPYSLATTAPAG